MTNLNESVNNREWRFPLITGLLVLLLTLAPYLIGLSFAGSRHFLWLGYNLDDSCVYLSWMRQAAEGSYRAYNLFTTDPQKGMALNPLFLLLGKLSAITHLPAILLYHASRLVFGGLLLYAVWRLAKLTLRESGARRLGFLMVCLSAGIGWLPGLWELPAINAPVDTWQPEAITFLSLLLSPLFCLSMALQIGLIVSLLLGEKTGRIRYGFFAGIQGLLLGFIHTYDVLTMAAIWGVYLLWRLYRPAATLERNANATDSQYRRDLLLQALAAGVLTMPGALYIFLQYRSEAVFRARANVATLSPSPAYLLLGYGFTLVLAVAAIYFCKTLKSASATANPDGTVGAYSILLPIWAVVNIAVSYVPLPFQRKMLQGVHFPIALLAGAGAAWLLDRKLPSALKPYRAYVVLLGGLVLFATNLRFMGREVINYAANRVQTGQHRAAIEEGEFEALQWLKEHAQKTDVIQPLPWMMRQGSSIGAYDMTIACIAPGQTGLHVYCGHWGETPDYGAKLGELGHFALPRTTDEDRRKFLTRTGIRYLIFTQKAHDDESADLLLPMFRHQQPLPNYLELVQSNDSADIYEVHLERN